MNSRDFERNIGNMMIRHTTQGASCPSIKGWPEDELSKWVSSHRKETKSIVCRSSQGKDIGFCGTTGSHAATRTKSTTSKSGEVTMRRGNAPAETKKNPRAKATPKTA